MVEKVRQAGVIGAGGAGFPTHIKLNGSYDYIIANGAECEPLLQCDQRLMEHESSRIVRGLEIAIQMTEASSGIVALKAKHIRAIPAMQKVIDRSSKTITLVRLGSYYPAGDEQVLVYEVLGRIVPEGGRPSDIGVLVQNVQTLAQIADAVDGVPVTERVISVHGEVKQPKTITAPIGARVQSLIDRCGGTTTPNPSIVIGGAMMGSIGNIESVIGKTTSGIYVLPNDHPLIRMKSTSLTTTLKRARVACEQCTFCTMFCPRYLIGHSLYPHQIMQAVGWNSQVDSKIITGTYLCCECGLCGNFFACPTGLSPDRYNAELKKKLSNVGIPNPHSNRELTVRPERNDRRIPVNALTKRLGLEKYNQTSIWDPELLDTPEVVIPLNEHIGASAVPLVHIGDRVLKCQKIAESPSSKLGVCVHSSIDGKVVDLTDSQITIRGN